ncbi:hypothetical protein Dalk_2111 [Desulfatibacillum aliphaticivorans]|uniref:Uncharacterized protein n=1 Tax=Desulfatibacillum aliphaticivorans TaxID=218208 RepID=B8FGC5_DESAL|nr:hypothetical protein Dalk_2111 [Desulfatibacillum aliphaticivorans]
MAKKKKPARSKYTAVKEETVVLPIPLTYHADKKGFGPAEIVFWIGLLPGNVADYVLMGRCRLSFKGLHRRN